MKSILTIWLICPYFYMTIVVDKALDWREVAIIIYDIGIKIYKQRGPESLRHISD